MLPRHHFRIRSRGTLSFHHGDKVPHISYVNIFSKNFLKLSYVIHIMIMTFKMFKTVVCIKIASYAHVGFYRNGYLLFPDSLKIV